MSRFTRLMSVAVSATPERLERCEHIIYHRAARGLRNGMLLDSQLERILKTLSERTGVSVRAITRAYRAVADANPEREELYLVEDGVICRRKDTHNGSVVVPLCNFNAHIVEEHELDDGVEHTLELLIGGELASGTTLPLVKVSPSQFAAMGWPVAAWGSRAVVHAGVNVRDHLRAAMQVLSGDVPHRTTYTHLGWRMIDDEVYFLHAGGALGADGVLAEIQVDPPQGLALFSLPMSSQDVGDMVRSSLSVLELGPDAITVPLLGAVYRAVIGDADFGLHLAGQTGAGKSELAAIMQQHFGAGLDARHLPGSWSSTANALEELAFSAKDVLMVIDDFAPEGSTNDIARYHASAARLFRAQGNGSARGRLSADGSPRAARPPRGIILSTGEDIPRGHSIKARMLILELDPGGLDWNRISEAQHLASNGTYAGALAAFIRWLAKDYTAYQEAFETNRVAYRTALQRSGHRRTADAGAQLLATYRTVLTFALEVKAINEEELEELQRRVEAGIYSALAPQAELQAQSDPVLRFGELLVGIFTSGKAHVVDARTGQYPGDGWGWQLRSYGDSSDPEPQYHPKGERIGWVDGNNLYLEPEATYTALKHLARDQGENELVSRQVLWKRLSERGMILSREDSRTTIRKQGLYGAQRRLRVLRIPASFAEICGPSGPLELKTVANDINASFQADRSHDGGGPSGPQTGAPEPIHRLNMV